MKKAVVSLLLLFLMGVESFAGQKMDEIKKDLLVSDPYFMENHKEEALIEKLDSNSQKDLSIPKRVPDKFVAILILPYVDGNDGWHDASKIQHKYKSGKWIFGEYVNVSEQSDVELDSSEFSYFDGK